MSLINQMLQDLDARKVAHGAGSGLPSDVRPLPRPQTSRLPIILSVLVLLVLVAAGAAYWLLSGVKTVLPDLPLVPMVSVPTPTVQVAPESVVIASPPVVPVDVPSVEPSVAGTELQVLDGSLRMADVLNGPEEKKGEGKVARANQLRGKEHSKPESIEKPKLEANKPVPPGADKPISPPLIEKTDAQGSPRERAELEYRKAIAAVNLGRVDEALTGLRNALRLDGFHQTSRQLLVKLLIEAKRPDEAEQALSEGLQGQPAQLGWAMTLARLQVDRGDLAGAWQTLNYSQPAASGNADYQGFSGHILQRLGRHKDAIERYLAAVRLSPNDGRWWLGLGLSLEMEGRAGEAREAFQHARQSANLSTELMTLIEQKLK